MPKKYIEDERFEAQDFTQVALPLGEYEQCTFRQCDFANSNLSRSVFVDCEFIECDWSMAKLGDTALRDVRFSHCKMLGLRFEHCHDFLFEVAFDHCQLNFSSFYQRTLKKTTFNHCILQEVDFTEANLKDASFDNCDLLGPLGVPRFHRRGGEQWLRRRPAGPRTRSLTRGDARRRDVAPASQGRALGSQPQPRPAVRASARHSSRTFCSSATSAANDSGGSGPNEKRNHDAYGER